MNFMDEYMAEGAPHLRALYARLDSKKSREEMAMHVAELIQEAQRLISSGFPIPGPTGVNLSPVSSVLKAYAHLKLEEDAEHPINPLTTLEATMEFRKLTGC